jgi:site-specific DNA recombinase
VSPKAKKPLDIYVRVSRVGGREGETFISPKVQEERCRALATARGYTVGKVLTDLDVSGGTMDRPALNEAVARITEGKSGGIIVARIDRFSRTMQGALNTLAEIETAGGFLIECDGDWDTSTSMGRFGRDLVLRLSQLFREQIADGWKIACEQAGERGVHVARAPSGYKQGEDGRLEINGNAETVRTLFKRRARGESLADLTRWFNTEGVPTRSGKPWSAEGVRQILGNRCYLGEASAGGKAYPDSHPALVDLPTYLACEKLMGTRRAYGRNGDGPLLGGLIRCADCGSKMSRTYTTSGGKKYNFYKCKSNTACRAAGTCASVSANLIEPLVTEYALALLGGVQYTRATDGGKTGADLHAEVERADAEIAAYVDATPAATPGYKAGLEKRIAARDAAVEALAGTASETERVYLDAAKVEADFETMTVGEQRKILGAIVDEITVKRGRGPVEKRVRVTFRGYDPELISYGELAA